jgi:adenylate kinase family enzyme
MVDRLTKRASTSGRIDDNPESIRKRVKTFLTENEPILEHLRHSGPVKTVRQMKKLLILC